MGSLQYANLSYLREFSGNDEQFVIGMVQTFLENSPVELENLEIALKEGNYPQVKQIVHKLKSSLGFLGIKSIESIVKETEELAMLADNPSLIASNCAEIIRVTRAAAAELKLYLKL